MANVTTGATKNVRVRVKVQLVLILVTSVVSALLMYKPIVEFKTKDTYPDLFTLKQEEVVRFGTNPVPVTVGMYVRDFHKFNVEEGRFVADLTITFRFDPTKIALEKIGEFTFDLARIEKKTKPEVRMVEGEMVAQYDVQMAFNAYFDYRDFPLDDHRINFVLINYSFTPGDVIFEASDRGLVTSAGIKTAGWELFGRHVITGHVDDQLGIYEQKGEMYRPAVVFSLDYERGGIRHIISIFIPLLLIFFISLFSFSLNPAPILTSHTITAITAIIAYRYVIETLSPVTSDFLMTDSLFLLFLLCTCIIFMVNLLGKRVSRYHKLVISVVLHSCILAMLAFLIFMRG